MARSTEADAAKWLMTPDAIRARAAQVLEASLTGDLEHFAVHRDRLDGAADYVLDVIRANYPDLDIPYHARWRHFVVDGHDLWPGIAHGLDRDERARVAFDLVVTSVLLDAGAGDAWRYVDPVSGHRFNRSEGLAIASFNAFKDGLFSSNAAAPLMADRDGLLQVSQSRLAEAFQVRPGNPLEGIEGRVGLINALGRALESRPDMFGKAPPRIGGLYDHLKAQASGPTLEATQILLAVLQGLGTIWPGRVELAGHNLGDTWRHPAARADDASDGLVPFHKLSQWLSYSLVEPLQQAGLEVHGIDGLTALAEYRNGGLLVDLGVLEPKHAAVTGRPHAPGDEVIVEWRALTVALVAELAERIRERLQMSADELPLAKVLEGGTWAAGRRIAQAKREGGGPPIQIISDGSVF